MKVAVFGAGTMGSGIAQVFAAKGHTALMYASSTASAQRHKDKLAASLNKKVAKGKMTQEAADDIMSRVLVEEFDAAADADLVIESMAEDTQAKIDFYKKLAPILPQKTVIVTNSSTLLPSTFAKYTGRPEKYLSLHFANSIWKNNMTEVMAQSQTEKRYFDELVDFANDIRMLALPVNKEKNGYLLNSMLVPWLLSGLDLYVSGVSDPKSIDLAWTRGTGAPKGPFRVFDTVGIQTAYNIVMQYQKVPGLVSPLLKKMMMPYNFKAMASVLKKMLDEGKLGESSGEGFFKY